MRKAIGFLIIILSIGAGLYLHDKYMALLIEQEQKMAPKPQYLEFINDQILPNSWPGSDIAVGGLSGLAWSQLQNKLYAVSDDRGGRGGPSRFYELQLDQKNDGNYQVHVQAQHLMKLPNGKTYPDRSMDPEGIALDSAGWIYVSSEGDFEETQSAVPALLKFNASGVTQNRYNFPMPFFSKNPSDWDNVNGVRNNMSFESLDILQDESTLVTTTESALIQDGDIATMNDGTVLRMSYYQLDDNSLLLPQQQHVYNLSAIPTKDLNTRSINGVPDIIAFPGKKLLVLERAYLAGRSKNRVKLFWVDCAQATDVTNLESLKQQQYVACEKNEIYDFDNLIGSLSDEHPRVDNIEGMTLGPQLESGEQLIIFVSDNNFTTFQKTQFLFFKLDSKKLQRQ